jgi:hypothetical protein
LFCFCRGNDDGGTYGFCRGNDDDNVCFVFVVAMMMAERMVFVAVMMMMAERMDVVEADNYPPLQHPYVPNDPFHQRRNHTYRHRNQPSVPSTWQPSIPPSKPTIPTPTLQQDNRKITW